MNNITVKVKLPMLVQPIRASYSEIMRPSGIQYLLLTVIQSRPKNVTWGEILEYINILPEMYSLFFEELNGMNGSMIECMNGTIDEETKVSDTKLTKEGADAFDNEAISTYFKKFSDNIMYLPADGKNKYDIFDTKRPSADDGFDFELFKDLKVNENKIENLVNEKKSRYTNNVEDKIFGLELEDDPTLLCYSQDVFFSFDGLTGKFIMQPQNIDESFIKSHFSSKYFIDKIDAKLFAIQKEKLIVPDYVWKADIPNLKEATSVLPCNIRIEKNNLVIAKDKNVHRDEIELYEDLGCDLLVVEDPSNGYQYWFVKTDVGIQGLEGSSECRMIVCAKASYAVIMDAVKGLIKTVDIDDAKGFERIVRLFSVIDDENIIKNVLTDVFSTRSLKEYGGFLSILAECSKSSWYGILLPSVLENTICKKTDIDVDEVLETIRFSGVKIDGSELMSITRVNDVKVNIITADKILTMSFAPDMVIEAANISDDIIDLMMNGFDIELESEFMSGLINVNKQFNTLKTVLGVNATNDYRFDLDDIDSDKAKTIRECATTMVRIVNELPPSVKISKNYYGFEKYLNLFVKISDVFKPVKNLEKVDDRTFGINLGINLGNIFAEHGIKKAMMGIMLDEACKKGFVNEHNAKVLSEFLDFRNICAHESEVPPISIKQRRIWINAVDSVREGKEGERK